MKKLNKFILLILLGNGFSVPSYAIIADYDLTKDWLEVTEINMVSWNDVNALFDTTNGQCQFASCILDSLDVTDYIWANNLEIDALISSYTQISFAPFSDIEQTANVTHENSIDFITDFNLTMHATYYGLTRDLRFAPNVYGIQTKNIGFSGFPSDPWLYQIFTHLEFDSKEGYLGAWFYKDNGISEESQNVPGPGTLALFGLGLMGLGVTRSKSNRDNYYASLQYDK